jgi:hypothetical protein
MHRASPNLSEAIALVGSLAFDHQRQRGRNDPRTAARGLRLPYDHWALVALALGASVLRGFLSIPLVPPA